MMCKHFLPIIAAYKTKQNKTLLCILLGLPASGHPTVDTDFTFYTDDHKNSLNLASVYPSTSKKQKKTDERWQQSLQSPI